MMLMLIVCASEVDVDLKWKNVTGEVHTLLHILFRLLALINMHFCFSLHHTGLASGSDRERNNCIT
jgi:hypothetical protein